MARRWNDHAEREASRPCRHAVGQRHGRRHSAGASAAPVRTVLQSRHRTGKRRLRLRLSITQAIVTRHGGTTWVTSQPGNTTCTIVLRNQQQRGRAIRSRRFASLPLGLAQAETTCRPPSGVPACEGFIATASVSPRSSLASLLRLETSSRFLGRPAGLAIDRRPRGAGV